MDILISNSSPVALYEQIETQIKNQILNGTIPNVNSNNQNQQNSMQQLQSNTSNMPNLQNTAIKTYNENDKMLCQDSLSTEKYVSSTYNTAIFEFSNTQIRQLLNHIQKEEQEHGQKIYNYMNQHGMYN